MEKKLKLLLLELKKKRYQAQPVKRVEIDKDDGGKRLLLVGMLLKYFIGLDLQLVLLNARYFQKTCRRRVGSSPIACISIMKPWFLRSGAFFILSATLI
ncbi:MAG: hypothetical protein ACJAWS_003229 [Oleiphilaceae bacterium]